MDKIFGLAHVKQRIDLLQTSNSVYKLCASVDVKEDAISELIGLEQFHQLQTAWQQEFDILKFEYEVAFTDDEKREVRAKIAELSC